GSLPAAEQAGRRRPARLPRPPGVALGRERRSGLRGDDRPPGRPARAARRRGAVLDTDPRARGARLGRDGQGAVQDRRRPRRRGGPHALPRRTPLGLRVLAVGLPADLHLLRDRGDEVRPQPDAGRDHRPGPALPPHRAAQPPGVHGHGRAADEPRQRARRRPPAAGHRNHPPAHRHLDRRLGARHPRADGVRRAGPPRPVAARARRRAALADHARQRALRDRRSARRLPRVLRAAPTADLHRVRDARRRQRLPGARRRPRPAARPAHPQGQPDPIQPDRVDLRRIFAQRHRSLPGHPRGARPERHRAPDARTRHRRGLRPARRARGGRDSRHRL
ncbi:MAG: 23S rRNA (adenine(2503)-C(2))-methyltransferase @ tRNA (adenine(37)-C(2))-methyltransferase, partial [uncultured Solirubrobacteraceae bacterium]